MVEFTNTTNNVISLRFVYIMDLVRMTAAQAWVLQEKKNAA